MHQPVVIYRKYIKRTAFYAAKGDLLKNAEVNRGDAPTNPPFESATGGLHVYFYKLLFACSTVEDVGLL